MHIYCSMYTAKAIIERTDGRSVRPQNKGHRKREREKNHISSRKSVSQSFTNFQSNKIMKWTKKRTTRSKDAGEEKGGKASVHRRKYLYFTPDFFVHTAEKFVFVFHFHPLSLTFLCQPTVNARRRRRRKKGRAFFYWRKEPWNIIMIMLIMSFSRANIMYTRFLLFISGRLHLDRARFEARIRRRHRSESHFGRRKKNSGTCFIHFFIAWLESMAERGKIMGPILSLSLTILYRH